MEPINQNTDNQIKLEQIIAAAQFRFGHFGLKKTTMQEIANDLTISKALLYYYFPDKEHLYKTVVEEEQKVFVKTVNEKMEGLSTADEKLKEYVSVRLHYFQSLLNLSRFRMEDIHGMKKVMESTWKDFYNSEVEIITKILTEGKESNLLYIENPKETAQLFLDLLKGLSQMHIKKKRIFVLEPEEYNELKIRAAIFTSIFIKGLSNKE